MANRSNIAVPEAKEALERFKMEAASEVGVNLKQGYNGDLTSKQAGSIGGQMVNIRAGCLANNKFKTTAVFLLRSGIKSAPFSFV